MFTSAVHDVVARSKQKAKQNLYGSAKRYAFKTASTELYFVALSDKDDRESGCGWMGGKFSYRMHNILCLYAYYLSHASEYTLPRCKLT